MQKQARSRAKLEALVRNLKNKSSKSEKLLNEYKRKVRESQRSLKKHGKTEDTLRREMERMKVQLKQLKDASPNDGTRRTRRRRPAAHRRSSASNKNSNSSSGSSERVDVRAMEAELQALRASNADLQQSLSQLGAQRNRLDKLSKQSKQLKSIERKLSQRVLATKHNPNPSSRQLAMKRYLRRTSASPTKTALSKSMAISEDDLMRWYASPEALVTGLQSIAQRQHTMSPPKPQKKKSRPMKSSASQATGLRRLREQKRNVMAQLTHFFMNPEQHQGVLQMSECGLVDDDVQMLAQPLSSALVQQADLRNNGLGDRGLLATVEAAVSDSSRVTMLDLRDNRVTMHGLATTVDYLLHCKQSESSLVDHVQLRSSKATGSLLPILDVYLRPQDSDDEEARMKLTIDVRHNTLSKSRYSASGSGSGSEHDDNLTLTSIARTLAQFPTTTTAVSSSASSDSSPVTFASATKRQSVGSALLLKGVNERLRRKE
eukprot:TRINITY_DN67357_c2_g2_i1.p1 TRINITY_DN67357_c2_g2~~TRINITY_DN67357_c2_g2_i1.p1  ORF type:complete len:538 (+),score=296.62 TRINITY_DN67357_c2_g2_i1:149-1615(+)